MLTLTLLCFLGLAPGKEQVAQLELVSDLRLGTGDEEYEIFADQTAIVADEQGQMFIMEPDSFRVLVFDDQGTFLRSFGREGQGPGEFVAMMSIAIDQKDRVVVFDNNQARMTRFKKDGTYVDDVSLDQSIRTVWSPYFFKDGQAILGTVKTDAQFQMIYHLGRYDASMALTKTLVEIPLPRVDWSQANNDQFWVDFLRINMEQVDRGVPFGIVFDDNSFLTAQTNKYEAKIYNQQGKTQHDFVRKIKPKLNPPENKRATNELLWQGMVANPFLAQNLTKNVFEQALKKAELSDYLPPIAVLFRLGDGFATIVQYDVSKGKGQLEVFSKEGTLIGQGPYVGPTAQVYGRGNTIYAVGPNDDDEINVVRYRVKGL